MFAINIESLEETLGNIGSIGNGQKKATEKDPRQFRPTIKNEKKEYRAVVRMIPQGVPQKGTVKPYYVERWTHSFQENDSWYFENCPSLLNKQNKTKENRCPVCESNRQDYDSNQEVLINRAKSRKVKKAYCTNILVIDDPQCPENNGKVMYWNMPFEIYEMIELKRKPQSSRRAPSTPYCPINGYDLELILKFNPASGYPTYSGSEWLEPQPLAESDEKMLEILNRAIDLSEFEGPSVYKPFETLSARFAKVTSGGSISNSFGSTKAVETVYAEDVENTAKTPARRTKPEVSSITVSSVEPITQSISADSDTSWLDDE